MLAISATTAHRLGALLVCTLSAALCAALPARTVATIGLNLSELPGVFGEDVRPNALGAESVTDWPGVAQRVTVQFMRSPKAPSVSFAVIRFDPGATWDVVAGRITRQYGAALDSVRVGSGRTAQWIVDAARLTLDNLNGGVQVTVERAFLADPSRHGMPELTRIIHAVKGDISGTGWADRVLLLGQIENGSPYVTDMRLMVQRGAYGPFRIYRLPVDLGNGLQPRLRLRDVTADGVPEVLYASHTGGSGGMINAGVYQGARGANRWIFRSNGTALPKVTGVRNGNQLTVTVGAQPPVTLTLNSDQVMAAGMETRTWGEDGVQIMEPTSNPPGLLVTRSLRLGPNVNQVAVLRTQLRWSGSGWTHVHTQVTR